MTIVDLRCLLTVEYCWLKPSFDHHGCGPRSILLAPAWIVTLSSGPVFGTPGSGLDYHTSALGFD